MFQCARDLVKRCSQLTAVIWIKHKYKNKSLKSKTFSHFLDLGLIMMLSKLLKLSGIVMLPLYMGEIAA